MITFVYFLKEITQTGQYRDWSECSQSGVSPVIIFKRDNSDWGVMETWSIETGLNAPQSGVSPVIIFKRDNSDLAVSRLV